MKYIDRAEITGLLDPEDAVRRIRSGFTAYSSGRAHVAPIQHLMFPETNGDACIKSATIMGSETFTVKVSTGFYDNPRIGHASNNGLMLVFSAQTGQPIALLADEGWLTTARTAIAGRIVAELLAPDDIGAIGMIGTGEQARLQLEYLMPVTPCREVVAWSQSGNSLESFAVHASTLGFRVRTTSDPREVANASRLIVCATPSRRPLIHADWVQPGTHITALGADGPGKQELDPAILARADIVAVDSRVQCAAFGEAGHAIRHGLVVSGKLTEIGELLMRAPRARTGAGQITVADLTGLAVQDAMIAQCIVDAMAS